MLDHIKQIIAPTGDWFRIQIERADIPERNNIITMTRVVAWAVVRDEPRSPEDINQDRFEGVNADGYLHFDEDIEFEYVHGDDIAPNGKAWRTVFNESPTFNWGLKNISALVEHWATDSLK